MNRHPLSCFKNQSSRFAYWLLVPLISILALLYAFVHPLAPLAVVAGCWFCYLSLRSPFFLLLVFLVFSIARLTDFFPILGEMGAGKLISIAALSILVVSKILSRDLSIARSRYYSWIFPLATMIIISAFCGTNAPSDLTFFAEDFMKTLILFVLMINIITTQRQIVLFQLCLSMICVFWAGYGILSQILGRNPFTGAMLVEGSRAGGVGAYGDPNDLAQIILMSLPFLMIAAIELKGKHRLLFGALSLISICGILSTQSRGGLIGLAVGLGLVLNRYIRNKLLLVVILMALMSGIFVVSGISERSTVSDHEEGIDASAQHRMDAWHSGLRMLMNNPLTGVGYNQFAYNAPRYSVVSLPQMAPHNTFIQVSSETGIPGAVAFIMMFFLSIKAAVLMITRFRVNGHDTDIYDIVRISGLPCLASYFTASFFLSSAWLGTTYILFAYFAVCYKILQLER